MSTNQYNPFHSNNQWCRFTQEPEEELSINECLIKACERNNGITDIDYYLKLGANINYKGRVFKSQPLHIACRKGDIKVIKFLIKNGSEINGEDDISETPIFKAHSEEVVELLLESGASIDKVNCYGFNLLHNSCVDGNKELIELFLKKGCEKEHVDDNGRTPLLEACRRNQTDIVKLLANHGCDVNRPDRLGITPLSYACSRNVNIVKVLIEHGCDIDYAEEKAHETSIFVACRSRFPDSAIILLENGCNINHKNKVGATPLLYACFYGLTEVLRVMFEKGANLNYVNDNGETPFDYACKMNSGDFANSYYENEGTIGFLIENGVEVPEKYKDREHIKGIKKKIMEKKKREDENPVGRIVKAIKIDRIEE